MSFHEYHLVSHWRIRGQATQVFERLTAFAEIPRWWPEGFLVMQKALDGQAVDVVSKGFLPYTLEWTARPVAMAAPATFTLAVHGDFEGEGTWTLEQKGEWVELTFVWDIRVHKPLVRRLSWLLRPLFILNHRWAMARGEAGLQRELDRLALASQADRAA